MALTELEPGVRMAVAPNPSPMTFDGTRTYVLGTGSVAVIDPGPDDPAHIQTILGGLAPGERVAAILVTHAHLDHSPGARLLAEATGARIHGFGPAEAGRSAVMRDLAAAGLAGGGEGVDLDFRPDVLLEDGAELAGGDWHLRAWHTPGHMGNHLSFVSGDVIFTGDVVMGWSTTLISPPDGDLGDYFRSLERLAAQGAARFYPGHGAPVTDPAARIADLARHRHDRTAQILAALAEHPATVAMLTRRIYADLPATLRPAAARNVFAHLVDIVARNRAVALPAVTPDALFALA